MGERINYKDLPPKPQKMLKKAPAIPPGITPPIPPRPKNYKRQTSEVKGETNSHTLSNSSSWDAVKSKTLPVNNPVNDTIQKSQVRISNSFLLPKLPPKNGEKLKSSTSALSVTPGAAKLPQRCDQQLQSLGDLSKSEKDGNNSMKFRENIQKDLPKSARISDRFKKLNIGKSLDVYSEIDELDLPPKNGGNTVENNQGRSKKIHFNEYMHNGIMDVNDMLCNYLEDTQMLYDDFIAVDEIESTSQMEDHFQTTINEYIKSKFVCAEQRFVDKMLKAKIETKFETLKKTFDKPKLDEYFGLLEELIEIHQNHFLPKFSKCFSVSDVCEVFLESENQLKMHLTDIWLKNPEQFKTSFAKKYHINDDFLKLPCDQLKIYFQGIQDLASNPRLTLGDLNKITTVSKLITKILSEWIIINTWLKFIRDEKVDLKEIGYVLEKEKCTVQYNNSKGDKKRKEKMDVFFSEKYVILTVFKCPYYRCVDTLPLYKIKIVVYVTDNILEITFGELEEKVYSLYFASSSRLKTVCIKLKGRIEIQEAASKKINYPFSTNM